MKFTDSIAASLHPHAIDGQQEMQNGEKETKYLDLLLPLHLHWLMQGIHAEEEHQSFNEVAGGIDHG